MNDADPNDPHARLDAALARIDAALGRLEAVDLTAPRAELARLQERHQRLRAGTGEALARLDRLIAGDRPEGA